MTFNEEELKNFSNLLKEENYSIPEKLVKVVVSYFENLQKLGENHQDFIILSFEKKLAEFPKIFKLLEKSTTPLSEHHLLALFKQFDEIIRTNCSDLFKIATKSLKSLKIGDIFFASIINLLITKPIPGECKDTIKRFMKDFTEQLAIKSEKKMNIIGEIIGKQENLLKLAEYFMETEIFTVIFPNILNLFVSQSSDEAKRKIFEIILNEKVRDITITPKTIEFLSKNAK